MAVLIKPSHFKRFGYRLLEEKASLASLSKRETYWKTHLRKSWTSTLRDQQEPEKLWGCKTGRIPRKQVKRWHSREMANGGPCCVPGSFSENGTFCTLLHSFIHDTLLICIYIIFNIKLLIIHNLFKTNLKSLIFIYKLHASKFLYIISLKLELIKFTWYQSCYWENVTPES